MFLAALVGSRTSTTQAPPEVQLGPAPRDTEARLPARTDPRRGRAALTVDPSNRAVVAQFFNDTYLPALQVPADWTGSITSCSPGTTSAAYIAATVQTVNFFRAMTRLPADVVSDPALDAKSQQAALMMAAQGALSHNPSPGWACFTADGAEAAGKSNLVLGTTGPAAIDAYVDDSGGGLGHRRMVLFPPLARVGTGSVDNAHALWVIGTDGPRPATPEQVAWPPAGFVPYRVVDQFWSFSVNTAATVDVSTATVTMAQGHAMVPLTMEAVTSGFGDETLVWQPTLPPLRAGMSDVPFTVTISNVMVGGAARNFTYVVTVFDPGSSTSGTSPRVTAGRAPTNFTATSLGNHEVMFSWDGTATEIRYHDTDIAALALPYPGGPVIVPPATAPAPTGWTLTVPPEYWTFAATHGTPLGSWWFAASSASGLSNAVKSATGSTTTNDCGHRVDPAIVAFGENVVLDETGAEQGPQGRPIQEGWTLARASQTVTDHNSREYARIASYAMPFRDALMCDLSTTTLQAWQTPTAILTLNGIKTVQDLSGTPMEQVYSTDGIYEHLTNDGPDHNAMLKYLEEAELELKCLAFIDFDFTNPEGENHCDIHGLVQGSGLILPS